MTLVSKNGRPSRVTSSLFSCQSVVPTWRIRLCRWSEWCWCVLYSSLPLSLFVLLLLVSSCGGGELVLSQSSSSSVLGNAWIPAEFLANYTFNSAVGFGECFANPSLAPADASIPPPPVWDPCERQGRSDQCLYLRDEVADECVCSCSSGKIRAHVLRPMRLSFCTHHALDTVLNLTMLENVPRNVCLSHLREVQRYDQLASRISCEFEQILSRYDCHNGYSSKWDCADCKAAYKNWVCAMLIPYQRDNVKYRPCRNFCFLVEQQCPYFLPDTKLQYAGESTFICTDPDIDEDFESISEPPPHADLPHCYLPCHLGLGRRNLTDDEERCHRLLPAPSPTAINVTSSVSETVLGRPASSSVDGTNVSTLVTILLGVIARTLLLLTFSMGLT